MELIKNSIGEKVSIVGEKIYKFLPLEDKVMDLDDSVIGKRMKSLLENQIWLSKYEYLNDPFEVTSIAFKKNKYEAEGACQVFNNEWNKRSIAIAAFSFDLNNMPLWAHYANNHRGYCLEYEIIDQQYIYPVIYAEKRTEEYLYSPLTARTDKEMEYMGYQLSVKAKDWSYEKECRIIGYEIKGIENRGENVEESKAGLRLNRIIVGNRCLQENKKILQEYADKLNVECAQAIFSNKRFEIYTRKCK